MGAPYRFDWLHQYAAQLKYGSFDVRIKVSGGQVVSVETVPGSERKVVTLQDQVRQTEE